MYRIIVLLLFMLSINALAAKKVVYKYRKYEKFDFDALDVSGQNSSPGDLSISPRFRKRFKNKLPERENFNLEIRNSISRLR